MPVDPQPVIDDPTGQAGNGTVWGVTWQRAFEASINAALAAVGATDTSIVTTDVTTNNVSTTKHGFAPKAPNDATQFLNGVGAYSVPGGGSIVVQTTTSTGTVNDFALTAGCTQLRCNNATLLTLTGLATGIDGQRLTIISVGAGQVDLSNQAAGSAAANRLINTATGTISLSPGSGAARLEYDATTARWRVLQHEQGAYITPPYAAGNFTTSTGTWTVQSTDVSAYRYLLRGRTLFVEVSLNLTTTATAADLRIAVPGGFLAATTTTDIWGAAVIGDNGTIVAGRVQVGSLGGGLMFVGKFSGNPTDSTNNYGIWFTFAFEVQ